MGILEGTGSNNLWGFSRALDLQDHDLTIQGETDFDKVQEKTNDSAVDISTSSGQSLHMLLVGSSDARHILKTVARSSRHPPKHLNFYLIEPQASLLARQMLLLSILTDDLGDMGIQERVDLFLECFGNLNVRERTANWIKQQSSDLIRVVTDGTGALAKHLKVDALKFRERDDLEFVFKFWRDSSRPFDASKLWDFRLRQFYKTRYDTRENAIDWDYHMNIGEMDPSLSIIYKNEFLRWRMHGSAFEIRDATQQYPNRTMATVDILKQDGVGHAKWGYFSDILMGPYLPFGTDTEYKSMLKKANDRHMHTSQEISEVNLKSLFHEFATGTLYHHNQPSRIAEVQEPNNDSTSDERSRLPTWTVHLLPCNTNETFVKRQKKYAGTFDRVFVSSSMAHTLPQLGALVKEGGQVIQETAKFMVELNPEQRLLFQEKALEMIKGTGLVLSHPKNVSILSDFMIFQKPVSHSS